MRLEFQSICAPACKSSHVYLIHALADNSSWNILPRRVLVPNVAATKGKAVTWITLSVQQKKLFCDYWFLMWESRTCLQFSNTCEAHMEASWLSSQLVAVLFGTTGFHFILPWETNIHSDRCNQSPLWSQVNSTCLWAYKFLGLL